MRELSRPISYFALAGMVARTKPEQRTPTLMMDIVQKASVTKLGDDLQQTFASEKEAVIMGLVAIWLALETWPKRGESMNERLEQLSQDLIDIGAEVSAARDRLLSYRWLRRRNQHFQMHPVYLEASLSVAKRSPALAGKVAGSVLESLCERRDAHSLWSALRATRRGGIMISERTERALALQARDMLVQTAGDLEQASQYSAAFELVASFGAQDDNVAMLVNALRFPSNEEDGTFTFESRRWSRPSWNPESINRIAADPAAATVARAFVREQFPTFRAELFFGAEAFVDFLYEITDVSMEFDVLVSSIKDYGYSMSALVAYGAARSKGADLDAMFLEGIAIHQSADNWHNVQEPLDEDAYATNDWFINEWDSLLQPANALIDAVLAERTRRGEKNWAASRTERFVFERFIERVKDRDESDENAIEQVFAVCPRDLGSHLVRAMARNRNLLDLTLSHICDVPTSEWAGLIHDLLDGLDVPPLILVD